MKKPLIAVDVDDTLADSTETVRLAINRHFGIDLQPHHYRVPGEYWGYYEHVWRMHGIEMTLKELDAWMEENRFAVTARHRASEAVHKLSKTHELLVITSRRPEQQDLTYRWLEHEFPDLFKTVVFTGHRHHPETKTKGQICKELGVDWLIDDSVTHARSALELGVNVILFGEHGWHQDVPDDVVHCKDWTAVLEYFDGRG